MSKTNMRIIALASVIGTCTVAFLFMLIIFVYILVSYVQKNDPPATFEISLPKQAVVGLVLPIDIININRFKVCPYRRITSIVDSQGNTLNNGELPGYPTLMLGKNPDIHLSMVLDKRIAPGPAFFNLIIEYSCPGNFFHAVLNEPYVKRVTFPINMLKDED